MKTTLLMAVALISQSAFAQLPEYANQLAIADLDPAITDLYLGEFFAWDSGLQLSRELITAAGRITCQVSEVEASASAAPSNGVGPEAMLLQRIDSADQGSILILLAQSYGPRKASYDFGCLKTDATGAPATFTVGDFKNLFPSAARRTGFFKLPRPRDS